MCFCRSGRCGLLEVELLKRVSNVCARAELYHDDSALSGSRLRQLCRTRRGWRAPNQRGVSRALEIIETDRCGVAHGGPLCASGF